jgi:hypothetical protein
MKENKFTELKPNRTQICKSIKTKKKYLQKNHFNKKWTLFNIQKCLGFNSTERKLIYKPKHLDNELNLPWIKNKKKFC